jgi:carbon-monoxide dehydrogenase small subunit
MDKNISVRINGNLYRKSVPLRMLLVDFLRDECHLTGTHVGCTHEGVCGACTVQLDGDAVKSCMLLAVQADGKDVKTVEAMSADSEHLHPLQKAFNSCHALQCGFCTPGILMNIEEFLRCNPSPTEAEVRHALVGNICRCTGYTNIVAAVMQASKELSQNSSARSDK